MIVMIVEDNAKMREMIIKTIRAKFEHVERIVECVNGLDAIEQYDQVHPDWVLMDIQMEPMDGLAASRTIMATHPAAKVIIVTNFNDSRYRKAAEDAGVVGFVLKENLSEISDIISR